MVLSLSKRRPGPGAYQRPVTCPQEIGPLHGKSLHPANLAKVEFSSLLWANFLGTGQLVNDYRGAFGANFGDEKFAELLGLLFGAGVGRRSAR